MKTIKSVEVKFEFTIGNEPLPPHDEMNKVTIYVSIEHGCTQHKCLCGCGEIASMSLKPMWENGWDLVKNDSDVYSFTPSILNTHCPNRSHYIITKNKANFV